MTRAKYKVPKFDESQDSVVISRENKLTGEVETESLSPLASAAIRHLRSKLRASENRNYNLKVELTRIQREPLFEQLRHENLTPKD